MWPVFVVYPTEAHFTNLFLCFYAYFIAQTFGDLPLGTAHQTTLHVVDDVTSFTQRLDSRF